METHGLFLQYSPRWSQPKIETKPEKKIFEEYQRVFPSRVAEKDLKSNEFLLSIKELTEYDKRLFEVKECASCGNEFRVIDKYNDANCNDKGHVCCSGVCLDDHYANQRSRQLESNNLRGIHNPVIYKITNKITGLCYIGKTTQAFTLRWYQHFFHKGDTKFHKVVKKTKITDWVFEVLEVVAPPKDYKDQNKLTFLHNKIQ